MCMCSLRYAFVKDETNRCLKKIFDQIAIKRLMINNHTEPVGVMVED